VGERAIEIENAENLVAGPSWLDVAGPAHQASRADSALPRARKL
jgi:hypothetical protein